MKRLQNTWQMRLLATLSVLVMAVGIFALGGCATTQTADAPNNETTNYKVQPTIEVTISIDGDARQEVTVPEDATVLDALRASGAQVESQETSHGEFVTAINGKASEGSEGWLFELNGQIPMEGAGTCKLAQGDQIDWTYGSFE